MIISAAFTTSDCSLPNFLRLKKHSRTCYHITECAALMAVQWKTRVLIGNCRDLDLWSSYFLFYFVVPIPLCSVLFLAVVVCSLLWSPWFASPASALSPPKHPVLVLVPFSVFVYIPALSVLFLWSISRSTLVYLIPVLLSVFKSCLFPVVLTSLRLCPPRVGIAFLTPYSCCCFRR